MSYFLYFLVFLVSITTGVYLSYNLPSNDTNFDMKTKTLTPEAKSTRPKLLIISLDGFYYNYMNQYSNELLSVKTNIVDRGVIAANGMTPVFPTLSISQHWTMATGLFTESHGLVHTDFYDPSLRDSFHVLQKKKKHEEKWFQGEPLWSIAVKQGKRFGVIGWIGSDVHYSVSGTQRATKCLGTETAKDPLSSKLNLTYEWMFEKENLDAVMLYHHDPDTSGGWHGPKSTAVRKSLKSIDRDLEQFFHQLAEHDKLNSLNIVLLSDHGMANVSNRKPVYISEFGLNISSLTSFSNDGHAIMMMTPRSSSAETQLVRKLTVISNQTKSFTLYKQPDFPERWHFKNNARIPPLLLLTREGFHVFQKRPQWRSAYKGKHGYDSDLDSMRPLFAAAGPSFKKGHIITNSFDQVHVFSLFCHLLDLTAPPNNASLNVFDSILE